MQSGLFVVLRNSDKKSAKSNLWVILLSDNYLKYSKYSIVVVKIM